MKLADIPQDVWDRAYAVSLEFSTDGYGGVEYSEGVPHVARSIMAAVAEERERCAQVCEGRKAFYRIDTPGFPRLALSEAASSIRGSS